MLLKVLTRCSECGHEEFHEYNAAEWDHMDALRDHLKNLYQAHWKGEKCPVCCYKDKEVAESYESAR